MVLMQYTIMLRANNLGEGILVTSTNLVVILQMCMYLQKKCTLLHSNLFSVCVLHSNCSVLTAPPIGGLLDSAFFSLPHQSAAAGLFGMFMKCQVQLTLNIARIRSAKTSLPCAVTNPLWLLTPQPLDY